MLDLLACMFGVSSLILKIVHSLHEEEQTTFHLIFSNLTLN